MSRVLQRSFYLRADVVRIARELLGKVLVTAFDEGFTCGIITETEAYAGVDDRASHAFGGRRTARTEVMHAQGGTSYIYLCYGMHHLFNVVTHERDVPHAVLIRAIVPLDGKELMRLRRNGRPLRTDGPALVSQVLGIRTAHTNMDLIDGPIRIEDHGIVPKHDAILVGPRIGVDYAGDDAMLPYRFRIAPSHPSPWQQ